MTRGFCCQLLILKCIYHRVDFLLKVVLQCPIVFITKLARIGFVTFLFISGASQKQIIYTLRTQH